MDTTDPHFEDPRLLGIAVAAGLVLFLALRWTEHRRRKGLTGFASATLLGRLVSGFSAARRLTNSPEAMALVSAAIACVAVVMGLALSAFANAITGPAIVLSAGLLFVLTLLRPQAS